MKASVNIIMACLVGLMSSAVFAENNNHWAVTVINDTKTPVYLTELDHNSAPIYWQYSKLEPGQSEAFNAVATDSVDDIAFGFVSGASMDAKGFYCYRDGRASALYTGKNNIYPATIKLTDVLNNTTCNESPQIVKALSSHPE